MKNEERQIEFQKKFGGRIIGKWLVFEGNLVCSNNRLTALPDNLRVEGYLDCYNNQLTALPDNLRVKGNLVCSHNQLTALPDNLRVGGSLYCSNNRLTALPDNLRVEGHLDCSNNRLTALPDNLRVEGYLDCYNNQLTSVPGCIKKIKFNVYIFENVNWNDPVWINKILKDELIAEEVFAIDNIEHRRIAYQYMNKSKMLQLKDYKILDEQVDSKGNQMQILSFTIQNMKEPLKFYHCFCPSSKREYFIGTEKKTCLDAKTACWGYSDGEIEFVEEW